MQIVVVILCILAISCAIPLNELNSDSLDAILESIPVEDGSEKNENRAIRQVAVNVGPIGVGVGPFGGVGVRVGPFFGLNVGPSYPVAYPAAVPLAYPAAVPVGYQTYPAPSGYEYRSHYRYYY